MDSCEAETLQLLEVQLCSRTLCAGWMSETKSITHSHCVWVYGKYGLPLRGIHCSAIPLVAAVSESCGNILQLWFIPGVSWTGEECERWWLRADWSLIVFVWRGVLVNLPSQGPLKLWRNLCLLSDSCRMDQVCPADTSTHQQPQHAAAAGTHQQTRSQPQTVETGGGELIHILRLFITIYSNNNNKTVTNYFYSCCVPSFNLGASLQNLVDKVPWSVLSVFHLGPNTVYSWYSLSLS